jgi:hypothetical protein
MRVDSGGGGSAPEPMSIHEEMAMIKRQAAQARLRQAQQQAQQRQTTATNNTNTAGQKATEALNTYNGQVQQHQQTWAQQNRGKYKTLEAAQAAWRWDWENSEEGKRAQRTLMPSLADYNGAVQNELRLAAANAGSDPAAVQAAVDAKATEIRNRGEGGTFANNVLDDIVNDAAGAVKVESPELRRAALDATEAFGTRDAAALKLQNIQDRKTRALDGVRNGGLRQEISQSFDAEIDAAEEELREANIALTKALQKELALGITDRAIAQQQAALDALAGKPGMMGERSEILRKLSELRGQRDDILAGTIDLRSIASPASDPGQLQQQAIDLTDQRITQQQTYLDSLDGKPGMMGERSDILGEIGRLRQLKLDLASGAVDPRTIVPEQMNDPALGDLFARHPELSLEQNLPVAQGLIVWDMALQRRLEIDQAMAGLPQLAQDPNTPQWMKDLIESDPVTAALAVTLGVNDVKPVTDEERELASASPITFAVLSYLDVNFTRPESTLENPSPTDYARAGQQQVATALERLATSTRPEDQAKLQNLQLLMMASGDVRVTYLRQEWERYAAANSPEKSLDQMLDEEIDDEDYNDPNFQPKTDLGRFLKTLNTQMRACFLPAQQVQIWSVIGGDVTSHIDAQARILGDRYDNADSVGDKLDIVGDIGEWQQQIAQFAPAPVAQAAVDSSIQHFDPVMLRQPRTGGRYAAQVPGERRAMVEGLQLLSDRAGPDSARKIAQWVTAPGSDKGFLPSKVFVTVKEDGTGINLGEAYLRELRIDGAADVTVDNLQEGYDEDVGDAEKHHAEDVFSDQFRLFNTNRDDKLREIFDGALRDDREIFTTRLNFGTDPATDNEYGERLGLTADNPNAGPGEARYTDASKLAKIHDFKQLDWIARGAGIDLDMDMLATRIARGEDLPEDENLKKVRQLQSWVREIGGDNAVVTFTPAVYSSQSQGVTTLYLMRVEGDKNGDGTITRDETNGRGDDGRYVQLDDEDMVIDTSVAGAAVDGNNVPWKYNDLEDYRKDNTLDDDGRLYMTGSNDLLLHDDNHDGRVDNINFDGLDAAITTGWETTRRWGDVVIGVAGAVAGVALIIGTGGLAAPLVAAGATLYFGYRTMETAEEMDDHGQSFNLVNTRADGAWFGFIDPTAGSFWLGAAATASGFASMRPLSLGRAFMSLGRGASLADETLLMTRLGTSSTGFSRGLTANLVGRNGLQANIYRAQLSQVPRTLSWTAQGSGVLLTAGQVQTFAGMINDGQLQNAGLGIHSPIWDIALTGVGIAQIGGGVAASRAQAAARNAQPQTGIPEGRVVLWAQRQDDGGVLFMRVDPSGQLVPDVDTPWMSGEPPVDVLIFETSRTNTGIKPENIHFFSRNRDGTYRYSTEGNGSGPGFTPPAVITPALGAHAPQNYNQNYGGLPAAPQTPLGSGPAAMLGLPQHASTGPGTSLVRYADAGATTTGADPMLFHDGGEGGSVIPVADRQGPAVDLSQGPGYMPAGHPLQHGGAGLNGIPRNSDGSYPITTLGLPRHRNTGPSTSVVPYEHGGIPGDGANPMLLRGGGEGTPFTRTAGLHEPADLSQGPVHLPGVGRPSQNGGTGFNTVSRNSNGSYPFSTLGLPRQRNAGPSTSLVRHGDGSVPTDGADPMLLRGDGEDAPFARPAGLQDPTGGNFHGRGNEPGVLVGRTDPQPYASMPIPQVSGNRQGDVAPRVEPVNGGNQPAFTVRMSPGRARLLDIAAQERTNGALRSVNSDIRQHFGRWIPANLPDPTMAALDAPAYARRYADAGLPESELPRIDGFAQRNGAGARPSDIVLRRDQGATLDGVPRANVRHEALHYYAHPAFTALARQYGVSGGDRVGNLLEGTIELLSFHRAGPAGFRDRPGGYAAWLDDLVRTVPDAKTAYPVETSAAEQIFRRMGADQFYKAVFQGDPAALNAFAREARAVALPSGRIMPGSEALPMARSSARQPKNRPGVPQATTIPGDGYRAASWTTIYSRVRNGRLQFSQDMYVYVVRAGRDPSNVTFRPADIDFRGVIRAGAQDVQWQGKAPPNANAKTVKDAFGTSKQLRIVLSPDDLAGRTGRFEVPLKSDLPGGPAAKQAGAGTSVILGDGYRAASWTTLHSRVKNGQLQFTQPMNVYVVRAGSDTSKVSFQPGDVLFRGTIQAGARTIDWQVAPPNADAKTVKDAFGTNRNLRIVFSPEGLAGKTGHLQVSLQSNLPRGVQSIQPLAAPATLLPGQSYPGSHWRTFYDGVTNGSIRFDSDRFIYVMKQPKKGGEAFLPSDVVYKGKIVAGSREIRWIGAAPNVTGDKVAAIFGNYDKAQEVFRFAVSEVNQPLTSKTPVRIDYVSTAPVRTKPSVSHVTPNTPLPAGGAELFPTRLWPMVKAAVNRGLVSSPTDLYFYVIHHPDLQPSGTRSFTRADVQAYGILRPGADQIEWQPGMPVPPEQIDGGRTVQDAFGPPPPGGIHGFVIAKSPIEALNIAGGMKDVPWMLGDIDVPAPTSTAPAQRPPLGFQVPLKSWWSDGDRGPRAYGAVQAVMSAYEHAKKLRGLVFRAGEGWVPKQEGEPDNARLIPRYAVNLLRGAIPLQDDATGLAMVDIHNHYGTFVHPFYIHHRTAARRLLSAGGKPGIISGSDVRLMITQEPVPYAVMRGGKWNGYTDPDTARTTVKYAHLDDWKSLGQWRELTPDEKRMIIPSITGIPTYKNSGVNPKQYLSDLLLWNYDVYPIAGELTIRAKELWTILTGRTGTTSMPLLSTDVGNMVGRDHDTLLGVMEALRDAGLLTVIHNDASFAEFAADGRPTPAPGDSRFFFGLMRLLMEVGPHDISHIPFDNPNFTLTDSEIASVLASPARRPLNAVGAHFFMGNITKAAPHHFEMLQMLLRHPLLRHVRLDASWMPTAAHMLSDVAGFRELILTGRVLYGGDVLNFQSPEQLAAPWFLQQPLLRALDRAGTNELGQNALNWYGGDATRQAYEATKPAIDWFRYRMWKEGTSREILSKMSNEHYAGLRDRMARYEHDHPEVVNPKRYAQLVALDQIPGQAPPAAILGPTNTRPRISLRSPELGNAIYKLAHGEDPNLNAVTGRTDPMLPQPARPASTKPVQLPNAAAIEAFLQADPYPRKGTPGNAGLEDLRRPDGRPYSKEAIEAATEAAQTGANRGLQLLTMALTETVVESQAPINADLAVTGNKSDKQIKARFAATFAGLVASAGLVLPFHQFFTDPSVKNVLPWIVAAALGTRGAINIFGNSSKQVNRKVSEAHNEQYSARPTWIEFMKERISHYAPRGGFDQTRFDKPDGINDAFNDTIAAVAYLMDTPLDQTAGETQELRNQFIGTIESLLLGEVGSKLGAAQGTQDPSNFRNPTGQRISWAAMMAYELGFLGSLADLTVNPDHHFAYFSALGALLYASHHALGAISGKRNANWTELPVWNRLMSIGTNGVLATGAAMYGANAIGDGHPWQAAFAFLASTGLLMTARLAVRGELPKGRDPTKSPNKVLDYLERAYFPGEPGQPGTSKPRRLPQWQVLAGVALMGLALTIVIDHLEEQNKKQPTPAPTPTPTPTTSSPSPTTSGTGNPTPSTSPTGTPTPSTSQTGTPAPSTTSGSPTPTGSPSSSPTSRPRFPNGKPIP